MSHTFPLPFSWLSCFRLSWADTAASTIGRLWGRYTPRLPSRLPLLRLPLAPRKSVAGFIAGSLTGAIIAAGFWGLFGLYGQFEPVWTWKGGIAGTIAGTDGGGVLAGWAGLGVLSVFTGLVSGVAEALGASAAPIFYPADDLRWTN